MSQKMKSFILVAVVLGALAVISPRFLSQNFIEKRSVTRIMHSFYDKLVDLKPLLFSREKFFSEESSAQISQALSDLKNLVHEAQSETDLEIPGYEITLDLMALHLSDTEKLYRKGYKEFSYQLLQRTSEFCISCHIQVSGGPQPKLPEEKDLTASFQQGAYRNADFFFATRQYDQALYIYDWLLRLFPKSLIAEDDVIDIFYKILMIHSRVGRDPKKAAEALEKSLDNPNISSPVRSEVLNWSSYLRENAGELKALETMEFQKFLDLAMNKIESHLGSRMPPAFEPQAPELMWYSGHLYQHLFHASTKEEQATVLYLLGLVENMIQKPPVQAIYALFLKKCAEDFPETQVASKCRERLDSSFLED